MKRLQLFEFNDQSWLPQVIRNGFADVLKKQVEDIYLPIIPKLQEFLLLSETKSIVDLCSGAGGPWLKLLPELKVRGVDIPLTLTDKYSKGLPTLTDPTVQCLDQEIDATHLPEDLGDCLMMFSSFHHFCPDEANNILQKAAEKKQTIGIFEFTERNWRNFAGMLFSPLIVMLEIPFLRPFHWQYLLFTYLIPIIPLVYFWDGLVSHSRSYTLKELQQMTTKIEANNYSWELGHIAQAESRANITYVLGRKC